jgi:hypothetical protein
MAGEPVLAPPPGKPTAASGNARRPRPTGTAKPSLTDRSGDDVLVDLSAANSLILARVADAAAIAYSTWYSIVIIRGGWRPKSAGSASRGDGEEVRRLIEQSSARERRAQPYAATTSVWGERETGWLAEGRQNGSLRARGLFWRAAPIMKLPVSRGGEGVRLLDHWTRCSAAVATSAIVPGPSACRRRERDHVVAHVVYLCAVSAIVGGSKIRLTRRLPQRGHIIRSLSPASYICGPRVQTSISRSSSAR